MDKVLVALAIIVGCHDAALRSWKDKLGDDKFAVRRHAQAVMEKSIASAPWAEFLVHGLIIRRNCCKDAEVRMRLARIIAPHENLCTEYKKIPWIDALPKGYPDKEKIVKHYIDMFGTTGCDADDWENWRLATKTWLEDLRAKGWWTSSLRRLQREMIPNELYWKKFRRYPP
jgi:hypothetical protein